MNHISILASLVCLTIAPVLAAVGTETKRPLDFEGKLGVRISGKGVISSDAVIVTASEQSALPQVTAVFDACRKAGFYKIALSSSSGPAD